MKGERIREAGNREAVLLSHERLRVVIDADKGMVPELSTRFRGGWINAHWQPWFRSNSGAHWQQETHSPFWKVPLLYDIAGNFPCFPNFGPDQSYHSYSLPPHGYTAFCRWTQNSPVSTEDTVSLESALETGDHPFSYSKKDLLIQGQNVHFTKLTVRNNSGETEAYNCGWHNTVGAPFLESGCLIDNNSEQYAVPPEGSEFDSTGSLAFGTFTDSLERVPLRDGGTANLRIVPGVTGNTDFISGAVPRNCHLGWSSVVNPRLKLIYLSFFKGPASLGAEDIPLYFYDLWMNYGGRPYTPWAACDGYTDQTFCLGAENITGYYGSGLNDSVKNPELMGNPTHLNLKGGEEKTLFYGTLFQDYEGDLFDKGIRSVEAEPGFLILNSYNGQYVKISCDAAFERLA